MVVVVVGELFNSQNDGPALHVLMTWYVMYSGDPFFGTDTCLVIDIHKHTWTHILHTHTHSHAHCTHSLQVR